MELSVGSNNMSNEVDKMAQMFLDQIGLQSSKANATSNAHLCQGEENSASVDFS